MKTKPNGLEKQGVPGERPLRPVVKRRYQPAEQMIFGTGFHTDSLAPIRYETRYPPNRQHDVIYISSYIHDATFRIDEMEMRRKSLFLPLNRARWELHQATGDLTHIRSELTISRVVSLRLELDHFSRLQKRFLRAPKVIIFRLQALGKKWDDFEDSDDEEIIIEFAYRARLRLRVGLNFRIRLRDLVNRHSISRQSPS
jgi:hypothetical protein